MKKQNKQMNNLIIFFIMGGVAGVYNLWRVLTGKGLKMGFFNEKDK